MSYQEQLNPWVIYRLLPGLQRQFITRFRRRSQAEEYLKALQRMQPLSEFTIIYDIHREPEPGTSALDVLALYPLNTDRLI